MNEISNIVKQLPIDLISYIFTSGAIIFIATHFVYKSNVKWRHKQVTLSDNILKSLQMFIKMELIMPIILLSFLSIIIISKSSYKRLLSVELTIMAILGIAMIVVYVKSTMKIYGINRGNDVWKKIWRFIFRYLLAVILMMTSIGINLFLIMFSTLIVTDPKYVQEQLFNFIIVIIGLYSLAPFIIYMIASIHSDELKRRIKHINVYYVRNGNDAEGKNIKYEDFDIDKNYFSFYLENENTKKVIPTKDLLEIEYAYKDNNDID